MNIETTINIDKALLEKIEYASQISKISKSKIITMLIKAYISENPKIHMHKRVRYQKRRNKSKWHCLHISINSDIYERCIDMRKLFKMSVSLIVASSIDKFLEKIEKKNNCNEHSSFYLITAKINKTLESYNIYWKFPSEDELQSIFS